MNGRKSSLTRSADGMVNGTTSQKKIPANAFKPGNRFGRGRKPGTKTRATQALMAIQNLGEESGLRIWKRIISQAEEGCLSSQKLYADKFTPAVKSFPVSIPDLPAIDTLPGLLAAATLVIEKAAAGDITLEQAQLFKAEFKHLAELIEVVEFIPQMKEMKAQLDKLSD